MPMVVLECPGPVHFVEICLSEQVGTEKIFLVQETILHNLHFPGVDQLFVALVIWTVSLTVWFLNLEPPMLGPPLEIQRCFC